MVNPCFKIITCGSDSPVVENDDVQVNQEGKFSADKRGWSFHKRFSRHRVLSNTVTSGSLSTANEGSPESANTDLDVDGKTMPEKCTISTVLSSKEPEVTDIVGNDHKIDPINPIESSDKNSFHTSPDDAGKRDLQVQESTATVIQAAIRGYLAKKELLKLKHVINLQAAVRGHMVRRQAVGSLRCVQAITKMQALVRARYGHSLIQDSVTEETGTCKYDESSLTRKPSGKENLEANVTNYSSTKNWLSSGFARQLLESTPKSKEIPIKCDPSRLDSSWKWLERWMYVSSLNTAKPQTAMHQRQLDKNCMSNVASENCEHIDAEADVSKLPVLAEGKEVPANNDANRSDSTDLTRSQQIASVIETSQTGSSSVSGNHDLEIEQPKRSLKRVASEQPEYEGNNTVFESRKTCNPSFIAVKSKFEELSSSSTTSVKPLIFTSKDVEVEFKPGKFSSETDHMIENVVTTKPSGLVAGLEHGAESSVLSTSDSPNRNEVYGRKLDHESEVGGKFTSEVDDTGSLVPSGENVEPEIVAFGSSLMEPHPDRNESDVVKIELETPRDLQEWKSSPNRSLRSHVTLSEAYGTPSSGVSVTVKKNKVDKSSPTKNKKSHSADKKPPSILINDSDARNSTEQLLKESKNGKRRNSFGSAKPDLDEEESRNSTSTLPSYMQATESARAKALLNASPRASPDVQEKDNYIKKRHSLPGANGKQMSPRMLRSISQAQQGAKGSGTPPTQERKWQR